MGNKKINLLVWEGKRKGKWHDMFKTIQKTDKNLIKCQKMLKNTQKLGHFATTKGTTRKGKYQMPKGKGKGKREIPKTRRRREKEKGNAKAKREKGKGKGKYQKQKGKGKGKRKYETQKGRKREGN